MTQHQPDFGALTGLVHKCEMRPRFVFATLIGGAGSGKTYGALQLARGIVGPGSGICLISCDENRAEELYAGICDFHHVSLSDPEVVEATRRAYGKGRFSWDGEGCDPRVALFAVEQIAPNLGPDGVIVFDGVSPVWRGVRDRVDTFTGGNQKLNGTAWQIVGAPYNLLWQRLADAPCHRLVCVRGKTETAFDFDGKKRVPYHAPVGQELRRENEFAADVRIWIDSKHLARFEGRLSALNDKDPVLLTAAIGEQVKVLHGHPAPADRSGATRAGKPDRPVTQPPAPARGGVGAGDAASDEAQREAELDAAHAQLAGWVESCALGLAFALYCAVKDPKGSTQSIADTRAWNSLGRWRQLREQMVHALGDDPTSPGALSSRAVRALEEALDRKVENDSEEVAALKAAITAAAPQDAGSFDRAAAACLIAARCVRKPETLKRLGLKRAEG